MGIVVKGTEELKVLLEQAGKKATAGVIEQMRKEARSIRDLARQMAPVDIGNLEGAIKTQDEGGERERGRFTRKSVAVLIDLSRPVPERPGKVIGDYAWEMHEHLTPYGPLNLGEKSAKKQAGQSVMVGGKFLERAADEVSRDMVRRLADVVRSYL